MTKTVPYGSWKSELSAEMVSGSSPRLGELRVSKDSVYYSEDRPSNEFRTQIIKVAPRTSFAEELLDHPLSTRTQVHEYGGGGWWRSGDTVIFSNAEDHRLWRLDPDFPPIPLTPEPTSSSGLRYADGDMTPDERWIVCVNEVHPGEADHPGDRDEALNRLVTIDAIGGVPLDLRSEADFVSTPKISPDGLWLAWVEWNHPDMPWDQSELWVAKLDRTVGPPILVDPERVAGGYGVSISGPSWAADGHLWYISDKSGWSNLYRCSQPGCDSDGGVLTVSGDFDISMPHWQFGESRYSFLADGRVVFALSSDGLDRLACYDPATEKVDHLSVGYDSIRQVRSAGSATYFIGASFYESPQIVKVSVGQSGFAKASTVMSSKSSLERDQISAGLPISFPTSDNSMSHGIYYPPTNPEFVAPEGEKPPLIVAIHGGPTANAKAELSPRVQFWTSRGFAYVDVNYRGSTGFGREYRDKLLGQWGVADVDDCIAAADYLSRSGYVDADRLLIRGSSAGGFTTLAALCASEKFAAGASLYGVADLISMTRDTHKFESRYLDGLIAPYPEGEETYVERSPISNVEQIKSPLVIFQGLVDKVVPPSQAKVIVEAMERLGLPYSYVEFPFEGHGFRSAEAAIKCLESELSFYSQVLGFSLPDEIPAVEVHNLS